MITAKGAGTNIIIVKFVYHNTRKLQLVKTK